MGSALLKSRLWGAGGYARDNLFVEKDVGDDSGDDGDGDGGKHWGVIGKELAAEEANAQLDGARPFGGGEEERIDELVPWIEKDEHADGRDAGAREGHDNAHEALP